MIKMHAIASPLRDVAIVRTGTGESVLSLRVCENRDGWLVAWGLCGCMLIRFSTLLLLPFTLL